MGQPRIANQGATLKVLIVSPYQAVNPHFEAELELAERHYLAGDQVVLLSCLGEQSLCDFNMQGDPETCRQCVLRRKMGQRLLRGRARPRSLFASLSQWRLPEKLESLLESRDLTLEDLKQVSVEGFDIGYACLSSLVSSLRDPAPDLKIHRDRLRQLMQNAWAVFQATCQFVRAEGVERVYVFNGRFAPMRAVLRAARRCGVECLIHERGSTHNRFQLFRNHLPHDIDYVRQRIERFWEMGSEPQRTHSARQWFEDRRARVERNWKSFTKEQQANLLPAGWDSCLHNVVLFCSSEDEFAAIGDSWDRRPYPSQWAGMQHLLSLMNRKDARLTVRLHPNLKTAPRSLYQDFLTTGEPRLQVIHPESPIDSYALLDQADVCVSFGSSVGVEAVYQGKPSILLGPCFYRDLGGTYQPLADYCGDARDLNGTDQRVIALQRLLNEVPTPGDPTGALKYAYWMQENGFPYRHYHGYAFNEGAFKGQWIYPKPAARSLKGRLRDTLSNWMEGRRPAALEDSAGLETQLEFEGQL